LAEAQWIRFLSSDNWQKKFFEKNAHHTIILLTSNKRLTVCGSWGCGKFGILEKLVVLLEDMYSKSVSGVQSQLMESQWIGSELK